MPSFSNKVDQILAIKNNYFSDISLWLRMPLVILMLIFSVMYLGYYFNLRKNTLTAIFILAMALAFFLEFRKPNLISLGSFHFAIACLLSTRFGPLLWKLKNGEVK
jgi:hypothetical protein